MDRIQKTELSSSTLEMIKSHKTGVYHKIQNFKFSIVTVEPGNANILQLVKIVAADYEILRTWIVGLNCLISNKSNLIQFSQLVSTHH